MLRTYQQGCVNELEKYWQKTARPCIIQLATGGGKSHVIAEIANKADGPVLVLQPTKEILEQNEAESEVEDEEIADEAKEKMIDDEKIVPKEDESSDPELQEE